MDKKINKASWPRTSHGTIDWEAVFEGPTDGLVSFVEDARSTKAIVKVVRVIVEALFARQSDRPLRDEFLTTVDGIPRQGGPDGNNVAHNKELALALLRDIKDDRIARAVIHVEQQKTGRETDNPAQADDKPDTPKTDHKQVDLPPFNTALAMTIEKRLSVLRCNSVDAQLGTAPLPFVLSKAFSEHLMAIIAEHIAPALTAQAARIIERAYKLPDDERLDSIFTALNTKRHREALWEHWCAAWTTLTQQTKPPSKPEEQKKSVMGVFSKKPKRRPGQRELTLEEWEVACTVAQEDNASALVIWGKICQSSDDYQAPRGEDNTILMNLFARTPEAMDRQSTALYQIAGRGRDAPEAFEEYQKGKDVDTALLAGCYKDPNVFIASDFLSKIMRDYTDDVRHDKFPLTARYLASFMG